jgi:type IV secretory pathway VirB6-like protein
MIVILVVLAMFFKVMDVTLYGNKIGDLYIYNEVKEELMISPECKNFYPLCFYNKVKNNQENNGVDAFFNLGIFFSFIALISRLLAIFGVMVLVLGLVTQSLIPTLLSVSLIQDNMEGKFAAAASAGLKIIGDAAKRGHSLAGKVKNRIAGMDQNKYKDGKEDNKNSEKENDIESEQVAQENNINKEQ